MNILIINPGSTSVKYSFFQDHVKICELDFEKHDDHALCVFKKDGKSEKEELTLDEYEQHFYLCLAVLQAKEKVKDFNQFGVRIVHGGKYFSSPTEINQSVLKQLEELIDIAPLHLPPALAVIQTIMEEFPSHPIKAVFDTAFHTSIPQKAYTYALSQDLNDRFSLRRYGFHGIVCQSIVRKLYEKNALPEKLIICHLGGGCSVTAVKNGQSIDTSMGFSPLEGLVMMTRSGDIDPGLLFYLQEKLKFSPQEMEKILNKESGIKGLSGSDDMKELVKKAQNGDESAQKVIDVFVYRIQKYIAAYAGILGGIDMLVFSGGIGEGSEYIRSAIINGLFFLEGKTIEVIHPEEDLEILEQIL